MADEARQVHEELESELLALGRRLRRMATVVAREADDELEAATYALLGAFLDAGDVRAGDLAEQFGLDKSTVSRHLALLESLGLVERVADPEDRRARLIRITEAGRARVQRLRTARAQWLADMLRPWPGEDVDRLVGLLGRLNEAIHTELAKLPR